MDTLDKVNEMLMEQMQKVKDNPGEIPVANAMCQIAGRVIDVAKTKVAAASIILRANQS